jgi:hypothetical protein
MMLPLGDNDDGYRWNERASTRGYLLGYCWTGIIKFGLKNKQYFKIRPTFVNAVYNLPSRAYQVQSLISSLKDVVCDIQLRE